MKEYMFTGHVTLSGATFYLSAGSREEAVEKARAGRFDDVDYDMASVSDCDINTATIELNE